MGLSLKWQKIKREIQVCLGKSKIPTTHHLAKRPPILIQDSKPVKDFVPCIFNVDFGQIFDGFMAKLFLSFS